VSELDEQWAQAMAEAERRARAAGRADLAEYLTLRAANDLARSTGIAWLFETFQTLAGLANRSGSSIRLAERDAHRFEVGNATMVGRLLTLSLGVRKLTVEAGWPRVPRDGFVRGGGLASARVHHFGQRAADEELLLVRDTEGTPRWLVLDQEGERPPLSEERLRLHLKRFLGEK
jgi:hypothetical protein